MRTVQVAPRPSLVQHHNRRVALGALRECRVARRARGARREVLRQYPRVYYVEGAYVVTKELHARRAQAAQSEERLGWLEEDHVGLPPHVLEAATARIQGMQPHVLRAATVRQASAQKACDPR